MHQNKILILEDDPNLGFILQEHLEMNGFSVNWCRNGLEGKDACAKEKFILCLVDVMMPKRNGFEFVRDLRKTDSLTPVIFLTAKSLKEDRIEGFKLGCDDYVTKPFSMEELLLRINAVLRRSNGNSNSQSAQEYFSINGFTFEWQRQVLSGPEGRVELTSKESELLRLLCIHMNRILEREVALKTIWGSDSYFNARSMDVFISRLRKFFAADPDITITNVHGKGYKLCTGFTSPKEPD